MIEKINSMSPQGIRDFIASIGNGARPLIAARRLFPDRTKGIVLATKMIRGYAWNRLVVLENHDLIIRGKYDAICQSIIDRLPGWAK